LSSAAGPFVRKQARQHWRWKADTLLSFPFSWQKGRHRLKMPCETLRKFHETRPAVFLSAQSAGGSSSPSLRHWTAKLGIKQLRCAIHTSRVIEQKVGSHQIRLDVKAVKKTNYHETKCALQQSLFPSSRLALP